MKAVWSVESARLVARDEGGRVVASWGVGEGIEAPSLASMLNQTPEISRLVLAPWAQRQEGMESLSAKEPGA